ncbi:EAL domain-containing protein [Candidatus Accumulibacter sp. ACC007]|uniref:putative bifunctional diguanylate cyclase/phosphodiesterase n=1 Tax=Candidatus Accumulibacter sp. ACC007 TaxID=2823333 RepID=UPI0034480F4B
MCGQDKRGQARQRSPMAERPGAGQALRRAAEDRLRGMAAQPSEEIEAGWPEAAQHVLYDLRVHQTELEMQNEELRRVQLELDATRARYFDIYDLAPVGYCTLSEQGLILEANLCAATLLGVARGELARQRISRFILKADQDIFYLHRKQLLESGQRQSCELRMVTLAGRPFWVLLETVLAQGAEGERVLRTVISDITRRKQAEAELRIAAVAFQSQQGMLVTDAKRRILRVNQAFTLMTGYSAEEAVGQTTSMLESARHDADFFRAIWKSVTSKGCWQGEVWDRRKNGEVYPKWLTISAVRGCGGAVTNYVCMQYDITKRKLAEERIEELAFFDSLTGLPNRTLLRDHLQQAMTAGQRNRTFGALLFVDLDHFKTLNDTQGHRQGDLLLQAVAQRLTASVRESDTVARLGGDEFVVIMGSLNRNMAEAATQTESVGEKILAALNQPYRLDDADHHSTASIGATLFWGVETSIDDLLMQADLAMYKAKTAGRNALHFFDPEMQTLVSARALLEASLRKAIRESGFVLYYQAQVAADGRVTGCEALLRWRHPERGMLAPAAFLALAEETHLIVPLGYWVIETACMQLAAWATRPEMAPLTVAVNVSAQQFREAHFVDRVLAIIARTGADPKRLQLELTESLLVDHAEDSIDKMVALKERGVGFSLDDFGTGYSSLSCLKRLPLDQLKIDQSFVRDILSDPTDAEIARSVVALARSRALAVIAEGVETQAQKEFLEDCGCYLYQGHFFSRPLPLEGFEEFVRRP